jgi:formylglycine-generating enzyme required for sulfatase activity/energy-coupling factor transporter ATP-binding protein EcfA2
MTTELFVAYAEADTEWVHGFLLPEIGLDPRSVLTPRDFRPGAALVTELERAVTTARFTVLVLSPAFGLSQWSAFADLLATHDTLSRNSDRLIPLLLKPCDLPLHLDFRVRLDCTDRSRWETEVARLRQLLDRGPPPPQRLPCPYPGLLAFGPGDAGLFFGRDQESDDISRRVRQQNFLLVVGPSGSGKSSLISAGVLPRLTANSGGWLVRTLRPDASALRWLTETLGTPKNAANTQDAVAALLQTAPGARRLLLFFDQAEAIFLLPSKAEQASVLTLLDHLRRVEDCVVLLAMRADFYADLMTSSLWPVGPGDRVEIAPLRPAALREAITRPAAEAGAYLEPVLVERLLHDAGEEPGALSLVQETMVLLWERMPRRLLTASAYEDLGSKGQDRKGADRSGLATALATRADAALASLSVAQRAIARRIFIRLVQFGEGGQDIRRPQPVGALRAPGDDRALFDATLRHLTDRRLVTISAEPAVDLGHEAMIRYWPTLTAWIEEGRAAELGRRRIERDAQDWLRSRRDRGELYRRRRLADARELAASREHELSQDAARFLAAGQHRRLLGLFSLVAAAIVALSGVVWLASTPVRNAWLKYEAEGLSPQVAVPGSSLLADVHEVSNQQYRYCVQAQVCASPNEPANDAQFAAGNRGLPVVWVTAYDAVRFCSWLGRRLPTTPEWERIAQGPNGAAYPWGNARPTPGRANIIVGQLKPRSLVPVSSAAFRGGDSPAGVEQLIGNAREWTATQSRYTRDGTFVLLGPWNGRDRVSGVTVAGGGYLDDAATVPDSLTPDDPTTPDAETGFRCAATQ